MPRILRLLPAALSIALLVNDRLAASDLSFRNDVMAVLSKAGCNMGVCHGNANGKGGFKLSLRGQDPDVDFKTLTRTVSGRRANVIEPDVSLLLLKPTMQVPHEGGRRFGRDSIEYHIVRDWIAAGMPDDPADGVRLVRLDVSPRERILVHPHNDVRLTAIATFSDGTTRDVSRLAVYEPSAPIVEITADGLVQGIQPGETSVAVRFVDRQIPVRLAFVPARPDFVWSAPTAKNVVDELVFRKLKAIRVNPSGICDDTVFLRRAHLDLLGMLPTADESRHFMADSSADKRARLIDDLLERQQFADFQATRWADLLRVEEKTLDRKGVENYYNWIRDAIAHGKPLNEFARELLAARGSTYSHPPANYYRAMRDPLTRAESTAQVFLGVRLKCAKCHNHPFDRWTQDDYYAWANLFARVKYKIVENKRVDRLDKNEFAGEQIVYMAGSGDVDNARTGSPSRPRFLGDGQTTFDDGRDRLVQLADWMAGTDNRRFALTQVNRVWAQLMGRGIVEPVDDFRATNPPSNPELLNALADDFVASGYNLRHLIRTIANSATYQSSSRPNETNEDDEINFSHGAVRRLTAEQLADAIGTACGVPVPFAGFPRGMRATQLPGVRGYHQRAGKPELGDRFLLQFGKPERLQTCECERSNDPTLDQTFQLVSGELVNQLLRERPSRISRLIESSLADAEIIDELYWSTLSRPPAKHERDRAVAYVESRADQVSTRTEALEDILWALINSHEFMLRR